MPRLSEEDGGKIKPAGFVHKYTEQQAMEIARCTIDPIYFIEKYVYIEHPTKGAVKFILYDFQRQLLRTYMENNRLIAMLSRQCGKTTTAAAFLLWWACFKKNQKILIASKDQDGANEIMERLWYAYEELPWWIKPGVKSDQVKTKKFDNNSVVRALATTATTGRGKSNSLVYLDEFAYVRPNIADKFWTSLYPTLATGGKCIITSTPNTDEDKFATIWFNAEMSKRSDPWVDPMYEKLKDLALEAQSGEDYEILYEDVTASGEYEGVMIEDEEDEQVQNFVAFHAHWTKVPDRDGTFRGERFKKEQFKGGLTNEEWMREFECAFVTGDETLISPARLSILRGFVRKPRFVDQWGGRWYEDIEPNMAYAVVMDPSEGVDADDCCIQVWEIPTLRQVFEWNGNQADQPEQARMLMRTLYRIYAIQQDDPEHDGDVNLYYSVERNGLGIGILNIIEMSDEGVFPGWRIDATNTSFNVRGSKGGNDAPAHWSGLLTSVSTKKRFCTELKSLIERNLFLPRSATLVSQLKTFVKKGQTWKAKEGKKDDVVMSCVLMCHLIEELRFQEPDLEEYISINLRDDYDPDDMNHPSNMAYAPIV